MFFFLLPVRILSPARPRSGPRQAVLMTVLVCDIDDTFLLCEQNPFPLNAISPLNWRVSSVRLLLLGVAAAGDGGGRLWGGRCRILVLLWSVSLVAVAALGIERLLPLLGVEGAAVLLLSQLLAALLGCKAETERENNMSEHTWIKEFFEFYFRDFEQVFIAELRTERGKFSVFTYQRAAEPCDTSVIESCSLILHNYDVKQ